ncbi:hypothetical protein Patl1_34358 [Pistacia atlantica]|uniref:Uncharacterized protein n=1 Tax=Pistacia atlantica TaxID=434234 RepID=A0ACC0ZUN9_9ROSI|nr:hypothetical protein Patl1_34358 [Pistacia atlantica]
MSFIFEQIDQIEKQKHENDGTLQRIRAWRQSKQQQNQETVTTHKVQNPEVISSVKESRERYSAEKQVLVRNEVKEVELVHPWLEWIELMEGLVKQNYFDHRRKDEDKMVKDLGFEDGVEESDVGIEFDKKVVFSAKLSRKHAHLDEGDVCSTCSLRSSCQIAYLRTNKEDEARTIDVMRVLLTCVTKKPPPKVKQPPPPPKKRVGQDDVEMKKGDWLSWLRCIELLSMDLSLLQCDAKRPKRQLLPGEWECPECNFLYYRRNMACFHCDCKRPPDKFIENKIQEKQHDPEMRSEKIARRPGGFKCLEFDFDDDGADVAAFEYADSPRRGEDSPLGSLAHEGNFRGHEDDLCVKIFWVQHLSMS